MDWSHIIENFVLLNNLYFSTTPPKKKNPQAFCVFVFVFSQASDRIAIVLEDNSSDCL